MAAKKFTYTNIAGLQRALRALPKEASVELKDASQASANRLARKMQIRASMWGGVWKYVAPSIKSRRDRVPVIRIGGKKMLPRRSRSEQPRRIGQVMWGAEFGGQGRPTTMQFMPHKGKIGYVVWPTIRHNLGDEINSWADALFDAAVQSARKGSA